MTHNTNRITQRISITVLVLLPLLGLTAERAVAADGAGTTRPRIVGNVNAPPPAPAVLTHGSVYRSVPTIAYAAFTEALKPRIDPKPVGTLGQHRLWHAPGTVAAVPQPLPGPSPRPAASTAPLSTGEKFKLFLTKSFLSPGAYAQTVVTSVYGEWTDDNHHHHAKPGDFAAESATRAARSFAFRTTANFFEKFAYASLFHQDPRYHRSASRSFGGKVVYAVSRVFVTQGDRCGCDQFNFTFIAGGLSAAGISNLWERDERVTVGKTFGRWGSHVGFTALSNILREFIGGQ